MTLMDLNDKKELCKYIVEVAQKEKLDDIIIYLEDSQSTNISVSRLEAEEVSFENNLGVSIKLFKNGKNICINSANFDKDYIRDIIKNASSALKVLPEDDIKLDYPNEAPENIELNLYDEKIHKLTVDERIKFLIDIEKKRA